MRPLRVGIIGAGFIGQQHVEAIRRIPGTEIVAIAENNEQIAKNRANQLGIPRCYSNYLEMLKDPEIDVVHNCTPNNMHFTVNCEIIRSKKHVYSEKPLSISTNDSKELVDLVENNKIANGVNFNYRQSSMVQEMHQRILSGSTGRIFMVYGHYLQDWLLFDTDYDWRIDSEIGGPSRAVADIGSHWFDLVQFVTGQKIKSIFANLMTVHPFRRHLAKKEGTFSSHSYIVSQNLPVTTEDAAFILIRLEDGTMGSLIVSQVSAGKKNELSLSVCGSEYSMDWRQEDPDKLYIGNRNRPNEIIYSSFDALTGDAKRYASLPSGHPVAWHDALRNGINEFYIAIRNDTYTNSNQNYATFRSGHQIMQLVEGCIQSHRSNIWVEIG